MNNLWNKIKEFFSDSANFYLGAAALCVLCAGLGFIGGDMIVGIAWLLCAILNVYFANTED